MYQTSQEPESDGPTRKRSEEHFHLREYLSDAFNKHIAATGAAHRLTIHDMPQPNNIMEHLKVEKVRAFHLRSTWLKNCTSMRAGA
jgi:hypothetical protein